MLSSRSAISRSVRYVTSLFWRATSPALASNRRSTPEFEAIEATRDGATVGCDLVGGRRSGFRTCSRNPRSSSVVIFPSDFAAYIDSRQPRHTAATPRDICRNAFGDANEELEATLTRWWKELLGVDAVGIQDNFFDLGGQSLTGVRLLAKIKKKYGVDLKLATLFSAPTIEKLCCADSQPKRHARIDSLVPIQPNGTKPPLFHHS